MGETKGKGALMLPSEIFAARPSRVQFNSPMNSTSPITPYSERVGIHPRYFHFGRDGSMQPVASKADTLQLMELGFSDAECRLALTRCRGKVAAAADWLLDEQNATEILAASVQKSLVPRKDIEEAALCLSTMLEDESELCTVKAKRFNSWQ